MQAMLAGDPEKREPGVSTKTRHIARHLISVTECPREAPAFRPGEKRGLAPLRSAEKGGEDGNTHNLAAVAHEQA